MIKRIPRYSVIEIIRMSFFLIRTKLLFKDARLIRFPFDIRGRKYIKVMQGFTTGRGCRIEAYPHDSKSIVIKIGENFQMNDYVHITGVSSVEIGNNVLLASKVYISDSSHGSYQGDENDSHPDSIPKDRPLFCKKILIKDNVWLGEHVSVLPGVTIGRGSIIGANSVVAKDIPEHCIAVGCPAHVIKRYSFDLNRWERIT